MSPSYGADDRLDDRRRDEGPGRVVYEDYVDIVGKDRERAANRLRSCHAAGHDEDT